MKNNNSVDRLYHVQLIAQIIIGVLFFIFLVGFSSLILRDLKHSFTFSKPQDFYGSKHSELLNSTNNIRKSIDVLNKDAFSLNEKILIVNSKNDTIEKNIDKSVKGSQSINKITTKIDEYDVALEERHSLRENLIKVYASIDLKNKELNQINNEIKKEEQKALAQSNQRNKVISYQLFGVRLLFVVPSLFLGVFLFLKKRQGKLSSLVYGYIAFSIYLFLFELLPYLPRFGEYFRYITGLILLILAGKYLVMWFNSYIEKRKIELAEDRIKRAEKVDETRAISLFKEHRCPSCGDDYTLGSDLSATSSFDLKYCPHCGLEIFRKCECGKRNFAFFKNCSSCGKKV